MLSRRRDYIATILPWRCVYFCHSNIYCFRCTQPQLIILLTAFNITQDTRCRVDAKNKHCLLKYCLTIVVMFLPRRNNLIIPKLKLSMIVREIRNRVSKLSNQTKGPKKEVKKYFLTWRLISNRPSMHQTGTNICFTHHSTNQRVGLHSLAISDKTSDMTPG
jgi:hypothetical protein